MLFLLSFFLRRTFCFHTLSRYFFILGGLLKIYMKYFRSGSTLFILLFLSLFIVSCMNQNIEESSSDISGEKGTHYVLFTLNDQDWVFPEESATDVLKFIELSETYGIPVDIYVADPIFQYYVESAPEVVERLRESSVVAVSYHFRPPMPAYKGFDFLGLAEMGEEERAEVLRAYEEHRLDLETGETLDVPGGYQFVKDTLGYAPYTVGVMSDSPEIEETMYTIYEEKGAVFLVVHNKEVSLGEMQDGLYLLPANVEIRLYEYQEAYADGLITAEEIIQQALAERTEERGLVINIKMHDNNFHIDGEAPFWEIYNRDKEPPFDLSLVTAELASEEYRTSIWQLYEEMLSYISSHPELFQTVNAQDLAAMVEKG